MKCIEANFHVSLGSIELGVSELVGTRGSGRGWPKQKENLDGEDSDSN